jgi:hypothetical protein
MFKRFKRSKLSVGDYVRFGWSIGSSWILLGVKAPRTLIGGTCWHAWSNHRGCFDEIVVIHEENIEILASFKDCM